jgi:hypothetical protein
MSRLQGLLELLDALGPSAEGTFAPPAYACPGCGADTVLPVWAEEISDYSWLVRLRCGSCGTCTDKELDDAQAADLGEQLDRQAAEISAALRELERDCMRSELHLLREALARDLIDAQDFDRRPERTALPHRAAP